MNAEAPPRISHLVPRYRRLPGEVVVLAVILLAAAALALAGGLLWQRLQPADGYSDADFSPARAAAIVERGNALTGSEQDTGAWTGRLTASPPALGDYLLRLFTSPAYLGSQADDPAFIEDAIHVLGDGLTSDDALAKTAQQAIDDTGSRLAALNALLAELQLPGQISLPAQTTRLRTFTLAGNLPEEGTQTVGLLSINAEARLTGSDAEFMLYSDGFLHTAFRPAAADPTVENQYTIDWDTRRETSGTHRLSLLLLTSDGRGRWTDLPGYEVPEIHALSAGQTLEDQAAAGETFWYSLPTADGKALLTLADTDGPLDLALFDLHAGLLASATADGGPAALRALTADDTSYVRLQTTAAAVRFEMAAALAAARTADGSGTLLGVQAIDDDRLRIFNANGSAAWQPAADYELIDTTARLGRLRLTYPDGTDTGYAEAFDPDTGLYGLVVDQTVDQLNVDVLAMEGSAAGLLIENIGEDGTRITPDDAGRLPLMLSENRLTITVTGFDGSARSYEVNILRPPHTGGFDQTLGLFPYSYRSPLWLLHLEHPAWQFGAFDTGLEWTEFITAEDFKDLSLVNADSSPASWVEPGSPVYDGSSWKAADVRVIEHFADPRNFLDEVDIFQFEKMVYNPDIHNREGLAAILGQSFMADGNAQGIDYTGLLIDAGKTAGVSPYYLAAKIIQEVGRNAESPLATGTLAGYEGYYNFYNIGSTPNPSVANGAQINGARFAQFGRKADEQEITEEEAVWLLPWNTPDRAITGGAIWIAQRYIGIGQDTLYLQKFDLIDDGSLYTHQYAQNIQMAWSEARNTRRAYVGIGLLEEPFFFEIPVFLNMPDEPCALP